MRVGRLRKLLESRPHKVIVCIGHATLFRHFMSSGRGTVLRNCELQTLYL